MFNLFDFLIDLLDLKGKKCKHKSGYYTTCTVRCIKGWLSSFENEIRFSGELLVYYMVYESNSRLVLAYF